MVRVLASSSSVLTVLFVGVLAVLAFSGSALGAPPGSDDTPPVTTDDYDHQWHSQDYEITLTADDGGGSGVNETYYILDDGPVMSVGADGQPMITVENGSSSLEYWSVDNDGNEELPHNMLNGIKLDKTAPVADAGEDVELPEVSAWMLNGLGSRDNLGIASYLWQIHNGSMIEIETGGSAMHVFYYPGEYLVLLTVKDNADNYDTAELLVTVYDSTYPEVDIPGTMTVTAGEGAFFSGWDCTDNVGIVSYYWTFGDGNESYEMNATHVFEVPGQYFVRLFVADEEGNEMFGSILVTVEGPAETSVDPTPYLIGAIVVALGVTLASVGYWRMRSRKR